MASRTGLKIVFAMVVASSVVWAQTTVVERPSAALKNEFDLAVAMAVDGAIRFDVPALELARKRLMSLLLEPALVDKALYFVAFADWQLAQNQISDTEKANTYLEDGYQRLDQLIAKNPDHGEAMLLKLRLYYLQAQLFPTKAATVWPAWEQTLNKARALLPDHPLTLLNIGLGIFHGPNPDHEKGIQLMERAKRGFDESQNNNDPHRVFWHALTCSWLGNHYLMLATPRIPAAKSTYQQALKLRPDFILVRDTLLPSTETQVFCAASEVAGKQWTLLTSDGEGDGADPTLADGKSLAYSYDGDKDMLWFQFGFFKMPPPGGFGVNLVVDADSDATNGVPWWGGNRQFYFDYLVTVWVARGGNGQLAGTVGIGQAADVMRGQMTGLSRNGIAFTADRETNTITLGFKRPESWGEGKLRLIGAVGSNARWNDDLPDREILQLDLGSLL